MKDGITQEDLNEDCPILMQKDFQSTIKNIAELPDYLRKINDNIMNIDKRISKQELSTDKVKQLNSGGSRREDSVKCNNDLFELNNIVKQSVNGLYNILGLGVNKNPVVIDTIEENPLKKKDLKSKPAKGNDKQKPALEFNTSDNSKNNKKTPVNYSKEGKLKKSKNEAGQNKGGAKQGKGDIGVNSNYNTSKNNTQHRALESSCEKNKDEEKNCMPNNFLSKENNDNSNTNNNNNFSFKPRIKKDSPNGLNEKSISSENPKGSSKAVGIHKENTVKISQMKINESSLPKRLLTEQTKHFSNKNTSSTAYPQSKIIIPKTSQASHLFNKKDNRATTQDILRLMLFFNEYIMSTNTLKSSEKNKETLDIISMTLSKALKSVDSECSKQKPSGEALSIDKEDYSTQNEKLIASVLMLQRKWRRYKVKDIVDNSNQPNANEKGLIKNMIVNNFIEKEGFGARKLTGMINSSIESFLLMKTNTQSIKQLADISLNRISDEERFMLYKQFLSKTLINASSHPVSKSSTLKDSKK